MSERVQARLERTPTGWRLTVDGPPDATPDELAHAGRRLARQTLAPTVHQKAAYLGYEAMVLYGPPDRPPLRTWEEVAAEMARRRLDRDDLDESQRRRWENLDESQVRRWAKHFRYATEADYNDDPSLDTGPMPAGSGDAIEDDGWEPDDEALERLRALLSREARADTSR